MSQLRARRHRVDYLLKDSMNEATLRRYMENQGMEADDIEDALMAWADEANQERSDREAEAR